MANKNITTVTKITPSANTNVIVDENNVVNKVSLLETVYPIGSIYMSVVNANPADLFGFGTWERWCSGRVPVGVWENDSDFNAPDKYGGEKTHTLTVDEMPGHGHSFAINIQHGDGEATSGESLTSGLQVSGRVRYRGDTYGAGGGVAHNNMPPYHVCYIWKRTA